MRLGFSAVVLAAGTSTRMAGRHKLLLPLNGEPVIRRTVREVLGACSRETVVVTGCNAESVGRVLADLPVRIQFNPCYERGQMTSVSAGMAALAEPIDAMMICLGDMPDLKSDDYTDLARAYAARPHGSILMPQRRGTRGNPLIIASNFVSDILVANRNLGCRKLVADHPDDVYLYDPGHDRCFVDLDTPADYARVRNLVGISVADKALVG